MLDEELNSLPEALRAPLVLCYLDGRTRDDAAAVIKAEADRVAQAARDADAAQQAEANRLERERIAAERAESDRVAAERQAELDRQAEENKQAAAALQAQQEALRKAQEPPAVSEPAKPLPAVLSGRMPSSGQILRVVADHFGCSTEVANRWLTELWG